MEWSSHASGRRRPSSIIYEDPKAYRKNSGFIHGETAGENQAARRGLKRKKRQREQAALAEQRAKELAGDDDIVFAWEVPPGDVLNWAIRCAMRD